MTTLEIQRRLKALGFDPGPLDGVAGRLTMRAVRAFQAARGLAVDGLAGPKTMAVLFPGRRAVASAARLAPWCEEARRHLGLTEIAGRRHEPTILAWLKHLNAPWRDDETPWCGAFVGWCIASRLPEEALPDNPFGARNWLSFGLACEPRPGAVLVFRRGAKAGWRGHVGFHAGEDAAAFHVLGGNQANRVSVARIAKGRFLGARWPRGAPSMDAGRGLAAAGGAMSNDEA